MNKSNKQVATNMYNINNSLPKTNSKDSVGVLKNVFNQTWTDEATLVETNESDFQKNCVHSYWY